MKNLLPFCLFFGLCSIGFGQCASDDKTLTELLFRGNPGNIFTCKVLTFTQPNHTRRDKCTGDIGAKATVEIIKVYFGHVFKKVFTLYAGSPLQVGKSYLIYSSNDEHYLHYGSNCDRRSKPVTASPDFLNELKTLTRFKEIFKSKSSGRFTFSNAQNVVIAKGAFETGKAIKTWKHYYENGALKADIDLENNSEIQYFNDGCLKTKHTVGKNVEMWERYSMWTRGQLVYKSNEVKDDTSSNTTITRYFDNGNMEEQTSQVSVRNKNGGGLVFAGRANEYALYYKDGKPKISGRYCHYTPCGIWKWYGDNGKSYREFDYHEGTGPYIEFYDNDTLKLTGEIKDFKRVGTWRYYHRTGEKSWVREYKLEEGAQAYYP